VSPELDALPNPLRPRIRRHTKTPPRSSGTFVLYWMRTAVRGHENPALDVALEVSRALGLPCFVYHALSERYPWASDRHHTFILEGAVEVGEALYQRGIGYAFHLERPGHRGPHLRSLANQAALVVTEEMPVPFLTQWTERLVRSTSTPVWSVDASLLAPLGQIPTRACDRAFRFREATVALRARWLQEPWPDSPNPEPLGTLFLPPLPFEPVELTRESIPEWVARCEIDHGVGPVPHTRGGSTAGYARWRAFLEGGLRPYADRRNNPLVLGVSRLSPYLHYGQVSPFRIAREAAAAGGRGAEKFLDELLIWRELAFAFSFHLQDPDSLESLPHWARQTLLSHERDVRRETRSWETMAWARTGDALWDAAQSSLLIHGELHNQVRMTWGKAVPFWTRTAQEALETLVDLNHRFALDGRDPNSQAGILWCLGALDRPFSPETPVLGTVRPRPTEDHARRLNVARWGAWTRRPALPSAPRVAVIGAGISGLSAARTLQDHGLQVLVVDKGRAPGGRISTRRSREGWGMDHGAQYFTARDPIFRKHVDSWQQDGWVAPWEGRLLREEADGLRPAREETRWVGVPGMQALATHLAGDLEVRSSFRVLEILGGPGEGGWWLRGVTESDPGAATGTEETLGPFDAVVLTPPASQTLDLLAGRFPSLEAPLRKVGFHPCMAGLLRLQGPPLPLPFDGLLNSGSALSWVARDSSKPGRNPGGLSEDRWILHGSPEWSTRHLDTDPTAVGQELLNAFQALVDRWGEGATLKIESFQVHRWRFAIPDPTLPERALWEPTLGLGIAGDALGGPRVEGAFLSGRAAAGLLLGRPPKSAGGRSGGAPYPYPDSNPSRVSAPQFDLLEPLP
jgi:photolyase PhrII